MELTLDKILQKKISVSLKTALVACVIISNGLTSVLESQKMKNIEKNKV